MKFAQIIDFETERADEMRELIRQYEETARAQGRKLGPSHRTLLRDRANPNRYLAVVEFDSYEEAMANSDAPETTELAKQLAALSTRPPAFTDCDVAESEDL
ncbi:hypothetical protein [Streptomyces melanogenes]|uniref:hypothetical protein n=1 Tax=Streptomyces melanogenes TaxID=67326 RepID=UPI00167D2A3C|nr:hypothetical protein [Streptomyces melanogenes]GGP42551.1 hypothetical protein GCM10010278_19620 [Streptomyces melanogenes]